MPERTRLTFTIGYQLRDLNEVVARLQEAGVDVLIDVRETAWSYKKGFSKTHLREALEEVGIEYVHARFVGNPKDIRRKADTHEACLVAYSEYLGERPELIEQFDELVSG